MNVVVTELYLFKICNDLGSYYPCDFMEATSVNGCGELRRWRTEIWRSLYGDGCGVKGFLLSLLALNWLYLLKQNINLNQKTHLKTRLLHWMFI